LYPSHNRLAAGPAAERLHPVGHLGCGEVGSGWQNQVAEGVERRVAGDHLVDTADEAGLDFVDPVRLFADVDDGRGVDVSSVQSSHRDASARLPWEFLGSDLALNLGGCVIDADFVWQPASRPVGGIYLGDARVRSLKDELAGWPARYALNDSRTTISQVWRTTLSR
jgi:hypothetical protein